MSNFVQVVISQNELKLLGSVEKWITLNKVKWSDVWFFFSVLVAQINVLQSYLDFYLF